MINIHRFPRASCRPGKLGGMTFETFRIHSEFITLGQLLKAADVVQSGGDVKWFLSQADIKVNDEPDNRRGRKLYPGDRIVIDFELELEITSPAR